MFQRFHEKLREREDGFTLIELLVVILIIAILAAIAIPVFLEQRKKGWVSQTESALKNAATAEESYLTSSASGEYTSTLADLTAEGYKGAAQVTLTASHVGADSYCLTATHAQLSGRSFVYKSGEGTPQEVGVDGATACAAP
jgi:type IV pilus assembly protein PilA